MPLTLDPNITPGEPVGYYASLEGVRRILGYLNLSTYSNLENTQADETVNDNTTIQADIDAADAETNLRAQQGRYYRYVTPIATTVSVFASIQYAANLWAAARLIQHRVIGPRGSSSDTVNKDVATLDALADAKFGELFDGPRALAGAATESFPELGGITSVPIERTEMASWECIPEHWRP